MGKELDTLLLYFHKSDRGGNNVVEDSGNNGETIGVTV